MLPLKPEPTPRELRVFAALLVPFCWLCARSLAPDAMPAALSASTVLAVTGVIAPQRIAWMYRGWMHVVRPIGWCVSASLLTATFFLILTPIGLMMRLFGHDPLRLKPDRAATFWEERPPAPASEHYLRQD